MGNTRFFQLWIPVQEESAMRCYQQAPAHPPCWVKISSKRSTNVILCTGSDHWGKKVWGDDSQPRTWHWLWPRRKGMTRASSSWLELSGLFTGEFRVLQWILRLMCGNQHWLAHFCRKLFLWTAVFDVDVFPVWLHQLASCSRAQRNDCFSREYSAGTELHFSVPSPILSHSFPLVCTYCCIFFLLWIIVVCKLFIGTVYI